MVLLAVLSSRIKAQIYNPGCIYGSGSRSNVCVSCRAGWRRSGYDCFRCVNNCRNCNYLANSGGQTSCYDCDSGHYLSGAGFAATCSPCPLGWSQCSSSFQCSACKSSYFLDTSGVFRTCQSCPLNCLECSLANTCSRCKLSHYFDAATKI